MNDWLVWRLSFALIFGAAVTWVLYRTADPPDFLRPKKNQTRFRPLFFYGTLPLFFLVLLPFLPYTLGHGSFNTVLGTLSQVFLQLAFYDGAMLLLLPLLRRYLQPQTCVFLWMLPNYLYLALNASSQPPRPLVIIPVPLSAWAFQAVCWVWLAGFEGVLGWKIFSHLRFRRRILKDAHTITDSQTVLLWQELAQWAGYPDRCHAPVLSPAVSAPLSIGLLASTVRVVLPQRSYTQEELALIFRHELIHIGRADSSAKFFLTFCSALCWFNPLVWSAMARGAEELELSCDQEVLDHIGQAGGEGYARLLLSTAGEQSGFTTCLSASASALRYRLRHVLHPAYRGIHGWVAGLAIAALMLTSGWITLSYGRGSGQELLLPPAASNPCQIESIYRFQDREGMECKIGDQDALLDYLGGLELRTVLGSYDYPPDGRWLSMTFLGPENKRLHLTVQEDMAYTYLVNAPSFHQAYQVAGGVDWDYLDSLLVPV